MPNYEFSIFKSYLICSANSTFEARLRYNGYCFLKSNIKEILEGKVNSQSKLFYMEILQNVVLGGWNVKMRNCRVINLEIWFMKKSASSMPASYLNHEQTGMIISWCYTKTLPLGQLIPTSKSKWCSDR